MARVVKEYDERYNEFLDAAEQLFYGRGYDQTSVQEIIVAVGVAKGTFYHYFASKADLLDALVQRMMVRTLGRMRPIVEDRSLGAVEKFEQFFTSIGNWKAANRDFLLSALRVFFQEENVRLRIRMQEASIAAATPLLASIIRQGAVEGVFDVEYPDEVAEIIVRMGQALSNAVMQMLSLDGTVENQTTVDDIVRKVYVYNRSIERVLGAAVGSLNLIDPETVKVWLPVRGGATPALAQE
jgi:AcrR family transcriptional regulator